MPLIVILGVCSVVWLIMRLLPKSVQRFLNFNFTDPSANRREPEQSEYTKTTRLQSELVALLKGDDARAKRLLQQERKIRPGMSNAWYLEKIVDDIRRDRS
ncbi:hypothetical protein ACQFX9_25860 [Aliinostoc sp. HNIBRCY26]|uniref:hypothetical protein n=1 Tax=Aliinostoc sp. HNIBRCY26 TaxID=3418997 RepID=UPI003D036DDB